MWEVSGTSGAAPVWAAVMRYLHASAPSKAPTPPAGVVQVPVQFAGGTVKAPSTQHAISAPEPPRREWFIQGTEQTLFALPAAAPTQSAARINSPTQGSIIAIDPDIPPKRQRIVLRTGLSNGQWLIDGKAVGRGSAVTWMPWPGKHDITLRSASGQVIDAVSIEVRGAGVKAPASKR